MPYIGECDSCGATPRLLRTAMAYGCEGDFCSECCGGSLAADLDDLEEMLESADQCAVKGAEWADDTGAIESALKEARAAT